MTRLTLDDLMTELDDARLTAKENGQASAMVAATMSKAKTLVNLTGCVSFRTGIVSRAKNSLGKTIKKACIGYLSADMNSHNSTGGIDKGTFYDPNY